METSKLRKFAQFARRNLMDQVTARMKGVLAEESIDRREYPAAVAELEKQIKLHGKAQVIERVAYIWFNRFCALRFMDVNRYNRVGVLSPQPGQFQPEILAEAKAGHIDDSSVPKEIAKKVYALLDGTVQMEDAQNEAYRLLIVAVSNHWNQAMPFLFEKITDYTELLMPEDLLSNNSILAYTREALTPDACEDVEVIGWLYQFYISEKKDEVFAGLKKNKKITPDNIPAATQLFTPHYIVRYLVENSLGRLWMLNRPNSRLIDQMEYYIPPEAGHQSSAGSKQTENCTLETDYLRISSPEEIRICDPACGSGHMLTYAFDLLYAIYEEEGYESNEIPEKILNHNLYGIEIDERAGELAAFALTMKARSKQRRFLNKRVCPNIKVLENVVFEEGELKDYMNEVGSDLFTAPLLATLKQFDEVDNFGSLIVPKATDAAELLRQIDEKDMRGNLLLHGTHQKVLQALEMADYLSSKYHVAIANPPYMGIRGLNNRLGTWVKNEYPSSKTDLFAMFVERNMNLTLDKGFIAMITMQSWMFLSTFEKLRSKVIEDTTILTMAHLGAHAFDSIGGEVVSTTAFILTKSMDQFHRGGYLRLINCGSEYEKEAAILENINNKKFGLFFRAASVDFIKIPGHPIAYWLSDAEFQLFSTSAKVGDIVKPRQGMSTNDNQRFLRRWFEVGHGSCGYGYTSSKLAVESGKKWFPYNKGGEFRKWSGNNEYLVNWKNDGEEIKHWLVNNPQDSKTTHWSRRIINTEFYFKEGLTWSFVSSSNFGIRYTPSGFLFDVGGSSMFPLSKERKPILGYLGSKVAFNFLRAVNPTLNFQTGNIASLPWPQTQIEPCFDELNIVVEKLVKIAKEDWDSSEISWNFSGLPLLSLDCLQSTLMCSSEKLSAHYQKKVIEMQILEEDNNRIFIDAYGLPDELEPAVPLNEITLTCNPYCRYGKKPKETQLGNKRYPVDEALEERLLGDTMKELISYAVGCMFGRYSLDKPGLILANQGETIEDYYRILSGSESSVPSVVKNSSCQFEPDDDNVIPILDGDWFPDDMAGRFKTFLRVTFGDEHYEENLRFLEEAIGKEIEKYFLKDFYVDHVKRYKKRPIYWLFSSPGGSFNALIYMHRYRKDTVSIVLNDYLREFREKLTAQLDHQQSISISGGSSQAEKNKALREITKLKKALDDVNEYEKDILFPLATEQIEIDLDDGVKANYPKFGTALKKITGLS